MARTVVVLLVLVLAGCRSPESEVRAWPDLYAMLDTESEHQANSSEPERRVTFRLHGQELQHFARLMADLAGETIVMEQGLREKRVVIEVNDQPVSEVIGLVARSIGVEAVRIGGMWYVGELRPQDRAVLVRRITYLDSTDLRAVIGTMLSDHGSSSANAEGLLVVADRLDVIQRVESMLRQVEAMPLGTWVVQMMFIATTDQALTRLGLNVEHLARLSASAVRPPGGDWKGAYAADVAVDAMLDLSRTRSDTDLVAAPMMILGDGQAAKWHSGQTIPIPRRAVSDQGTVTTVGYEYVEDGFRVNLLARDHGRGRMVLEYKITASQVAGFVESAPILATDDLEAMAVLGTGDVYLLGSLDLNVDRSSSAGPLIPTQLEQERRRRHLQCWARVYRIGPLQAQAPGWPDE